jgi:long-chain fatty acid transport protein
MAVGLSLLTAQLAFGAGFAIYEGSARGNALGGTLVGRADDASALYYNPAGITQLPGIQAMGGVTVIMPQTDVVTTFQGIRTTSETEDNVWLPPHLYATYQFSDAIWFGLGVFSPFGLGTEFDEDWPGRYNNYNAVIKTVALNPNIAVKMSDQFSFAAGFSITWFDLKLENKIDGSRFLGNPNFNNPNVSTFDVDQSLTGSSLGYGFNFGAHYRPVDWMSLGLSYRSRVKQAIHDADADFSKPLALTRALGALDPLFFEDSSVDGTVTLPDMFFWGVNVKPIDRLSVEVGGVWTRWSTYDALTIRYSEPIVTIPGVLSISQVSRAKEWDDVLRFAVGAEYKALDWLDVRLGYVYDNEPIPENTADYLVPANDRQLYNIGLGFRWESWTADLSYTYLDIKGRSIPARRAEGVFDSQFKNGDANLIGVTVGYKF